MDGVEVAGKPQTQTLEPKRKTWAKDAKIFYGYEWLREAAGHGPKNVRQIKRFPVLRSLAHGL